MSVSKPDQSVFARCAGPAAAGVLAGVISLLMTRRGVLLTPDGWGYWEGSVSLLQGQGYCYFGGQPVTSFPPGFSGFLAVTQLLLGISGGTLGWSLALLAAWNAAVWTGNFNRLAAPNGSHWLKWNTAAFIACFTGVNYDTLLSETLFLPLLGMMLHGVTLLADDSGEKRRAGAVWLATSFSLALLTRHAALVMFPGLLLLFWLLRRAWRVKTRLLALCLAVPFAAWSVWRALSGQSDSHALAAGQLLEGDKSVFIFLGQGLRDLGYRLGWSAGGSLGWLLWLGLAVLLVRGGSAARREGPRGRLILCGWVAGTCLAWLVLAALCSLTGIGDQMAGRFNWFLVVGVAGASFAQASYETKLRWKQVSALLLGAVTLIQVSRTCFYVLARAGKDANVRPAHTISPRSVWLAETGAGSRSLQLVEPPDFPWIDRRYLERQTTP